MTAASLASPRSVLITGASSGIGRALALAHAAPGVHLALTGRDTGRLAAIASDVEGRGATVTTAAIDVTDGDGIAAWIGEIDAAHGLDLVYANAGISRHVKDLSDIDQMTRDVFDTNITGVLNTVHPALDAMRARGHGQIAIMASLAGLITLKHAPAYCASKACVLSYGESLRKTLKGTGISVSTICPGFVKSPLTGKNDFPMPFLMEAEKAAAIIKRGLAKDKARIAFPWRFLVVVRAASCLPAGLWDWIAGR